MDKDEPDQELDNCANNINRQNELNLLGLGFLIIDCARAIIRQLQYMENNTREWRQYHIDRDRMIETRRQEWLSTKINKGKESHG